MNTTIRSIAIGTLAQLADFIRIADSNHYTESSELLLGSSIGQHVRHILEFYHCLKEGYAFQKVNYDLRKRELSIEQDPSVALVMIKELVQWLQEAEPVALTLEGSYTPGDEHTFSIATHLERELVYNIEHSIHHMAIIKIAALNLYLYELPADFGIAASTLRHRQHVYC